VFELETGCLVTKETSMQLTFCSANYVARAANYALHPFNWGEAERLTVERTTRETFDEMCRDVAAAGFGSIEVWKGHAWPTGLDEARAAALRESLARHGLTAVSYAGGVNGPDAEAMLRATRMLGMDLVAGTLSAERAPEVARLAREHGARIGIENHPEHHPDEVLAKIGENADVIGACIDTGWWLTQGYDPAAAIRALGQHLFHVHLKDIHAAGKHETCALGDGLLDVAAVLAALREVGYDGYLSVEHEPEDYDPTAEVVRSRELVERLLQGM
jgi:sugar phosphate isomerase/epimerase